MSDDDRKDLPPTDPWAKWRKPAAPAVHEEKTAKTEEAPAAKPVAEATPAGEVPSEPQRPVGTLSVRKVVKAASLPEKSKGKPGKPREGRTERRDERPAGKPWEKSGERKGERTGGAGSERSGNRTDSRYDRRSGGRSDTRSNENPWAKTVERRNENPWAKSADSGRVTRVEGEWSAAKGAPAQQPASIKAEGEAPSGVRLSKVMSERGICSRREADLWIERGWVFVDGEQISELGTRIDPAAEITISKEAAKDQAKAVTILLHKPVGYVSGQPEPDCVPAVTLITAENQLPNSGGPEFKPWMLRGLAPAGRLDVDSTGLLVLTSDGRVAKRLIGEDSDAEKEYLVRVSGQMIPGGLELLRHGLELDGKALKPAWVKQLNEDQLHFILKEGKKRQIRRMCELVGLKVIGLKRVRIGRIRLGDLPMGQWRFLREGEAF
ncbi:pseudouridine synthase [Azonexus sp. IMCC34839]|uniref:pseudouridine synthase n=1 Tax=Azonexus sp. IMCC34839 TaxID=3133695 RepID=UPI00399BF523